MVAFVTRDDDILIVVILAHITLEWTFSNMGAHISGDCGTITAAIIEHVALVTLQFGIFVSEYADMLD